MISLDEWVFEEGAFGSDSFTSVDEASIAKAPTVEEIVATFERFQRLIEEDRKREEDMWERFWWRIIRNRPRFLVCET